MLLISDMDLIVRVVLVNHTLRVHYLSAIAAYPNESYFRSEGVGTGQLHLYNVLRAYSNFDIEVGYCQGT